MSARLISRCAFRSPDVSGYFAENVFQPEWFAHVINRPKLQRQCLVSFRQTPGHENDRDRAKFGIPFDSAANLEPVNIRQINVGKNEVAVLFFDESQAAGAGRRQAVDTLGADRIVLGSDFPYEAGELYKRAIGYVEQSGLKKEDATKILDFNAANLLGML